LHDGIIQNIYAAGLSLEEARYLVVDDPPLAQKQIRSVMNALNQAIQDIRRYIFDLQLAEQTRELEIVLENLVRDLRLDTMLEVDLEVVGQRCCWLGSEQVGHVTQVAREALSNVVQHAEATRVVVSLFYLGNATQLVVKDNGKGLDLESLDSGSRVGQGIANMQERARLLGGELVLDGEPGYGMHLVLTIPCLGHADGEPELMEQTTWD